MIQQFSLLAAILFSVAYAQIANFNGETIVLGDELLPVSDEGANVSTRGSYEYPVDHAWVQDVVDRVNAKRAAGGTCGSTYYAPSSPLKLSPALTVASMEFVQEKCAFGYDSGPPPQNSAHYGHDGSSAGDRIERTNFPGWNNALCPGWGENAARGQISPQAVVDAWYLSSGHCANMMDPYFKFIGVGIANCPSGGLHWIQKFVGGSSNCLSVTNFNAGDNLNDITMGKVRGFTVANKSRREFTLKYSVGYSAEKTTFVLKSSGNVISKVTRKPTNEWNRRIKFTGLTPNTRYKVIAISKRKGVRSTRKAIIVRTKA